MGEGKGEREGGRETIYIYIWRERGGEEKGIYRRIEGGE